jgi:hypothetical protein
MKMTLRQMQVDGRIPDVGVPEQHLNRTKIRAGIQHVSRKRVAQRMRPDLLLYTGPLSGYPAGVPDRLRSDGKVSATLVPARKQVGLRLQPAPILAQRFQRSLAERHIAVLVPLASMDVDHHALSVDVGYFEPGQLRTTHAGGVECHQHGAMEQVDCRVDHPPDFFRAEDDRRSSGSPGINEVIRSARPSESADKQETDCSHMLHDRPGRQSSVTQHVKLIVPHLLRPQSIGGRR